MCRTDRWVIALILTAAGAARLAAQQTRSPDVVRIPDTPACAACRIELVKVFTIGGADGPVPYNRPVAAALDSEKRLYLSMYTVTYEVAVFDSAGRHVTTIGRRGAGPGEFFNVTHLVPTRAGLLAFDDAAAAVTLLSWDLEMVERKPLPASPIRVLAHTGGSFVLNALVATADRIGQPLHVVGDSGRIDRSFGDNGAPFTGRQSLAIVRALAQAPGQQTIWAANVTDYILEEWTLSGERRRRFERDARWFPHVVQNRDLPEAILKDIRFDESGLLWVLVNVRDERWRSVWWSTAPASYMMRPRSEAEGNALWDTLVEVIDVRRGQLIARTRVDPNVLFAGPRRILAYEELADGTPAITLWEARLITPTSGGVK